MGDTIAVVHTPFDRTRPSAPTRTDRPIACSVGIMAYNEEANISHAIDAVLAQEGPAFHIEEVIVVASGCTDRTVPVVAEVACRETRVRLCVQERREGKASAINLFLKQAASPVVVLFGADILPAPLALEYLCTPLKDPRIGMVGGRPVPVNDPATFMGHAVHLLWRLHHHLASVHPKLGEVIAFRNVIPGIPTDTPVDEISIQALISQLGYETVYEPASIVYNKGPLGVFDFLKQRRRIYAGHLQVRMTQQYDASTMRVLPIIRQIVTCRSFAMGSPRRAAWTLATVALEALARAQGYVDYRQNKQHHIWQMVASTKDLDAGRRSPACRAQSVLVFRLILVDADARDPYLEDREREAAEATRQLLPVLQARLHKRDRVSIGGPGILTAVIRAEQPEADLVAKDVQSALTATSVQIGRRSREAKVSVAYSTLTFTSSPNADGVKAPLAGDLHSLQGDI